MSTAKTATPSIDVQLLQEIRSYIERRFSEAEIEKNPFPHILIENFFPERVFADILRLNPFQSQDGEEWIKQKNSKELVKVNLTPYHLRRQVNFHKGSQEMSTSEGQVFWDTLRECFLSQDHWFEKLVIDKYRDYFDIRFGSFLDREDFFDRFTPEFFLQRHSPGYFIGPHTDIPTRVFTCLFSFAESEGFEEYGTQICVPKDPMNRCWGNRHYSWDEFEVVKVAPYKPNNFFLFFKTRQSFHAVRKLDKAIPNERYGMQFQFYEPPSGLFNDMSAPDIMTVKRHKPEPQESSRPKRGVVNRLVGKISGKLSSK